MKTAAPLLLLIAAGTATAAGPYSYGLSQTIAHESNLIRAEEGIVLPEGVSRSDTLYTTTLFGGVDQTIGRQRLLGDVSLRHTRFAQNSRYDNDGWRLGLKLDWATINRLTGSLSYSEQRSLAPFSNDEAGVLDTINTERTRQAESSLRWGASARLAAEASLQWRRVDFSAPQFASREFDQTSLYAGLRYAPSASSSFGFGLRSSRGDYPKFQLLADGSFEGDHFRRDELELKAILTPGGASDLSARLGFGRTQYDSNNSRDVSGLFGALEWNWKPTGRLRWRLQLSRDPSQDAYFLSTLFGRGTLSYDRMATTLQVRADYELTGKTAIYAAAGVTQRSLQRTIEVSAGVASDIRADDRTQQFGIGLRWQPMRTLLFGIDLASEERRKASALSRPYSSTTVSGFGQLTLQ